MISKAELNRIIKKLEGVDISSIDNLLKRVITI